MSTMKKQTFIRHIKPILAIEVLVVAVLLLAACEPQPITENIVVSPKITPSTNQVEKIEHFKITSKGTFRAGYDDGIREILIIKDNATGEEFLAITDCTLIRRVKAKKEAQEETADVVADVLSAFIE